jgi:hypothetical protein
MNRKLTACCAGLVFLLPGCVSHTWAPGPTATTPFGQASGQCKLTAMSGQQGFLAVGSASYVAGAAVGSGIGNAVRQNRIYNACMEASGFIAVDEQSSPALDAPTYCGGGPSGGGGGPGQEPIITCR